MNTRGELLDVKAAAEFLGMTESALRARVYRGQVPYPPELSTVLIFTQHST
jgi:hypothetical protein